MILFLLLALLVILVAYLIVYHPSRRAGILFAGLPTYSNLPILGSIHHFFGGAEVIFKRVSEISEIIEETNSPFVIYAGPLPVIITHDLEDLKKITTTFVEKPYYYNFGRLWLGNGLVTAPVPLWKYKIKKLAGTFNTAIVESYQEVFNWQAAKLTEKLKGETGAEPFDALEKYIAYATLETICLCLTNETDKTGAGSSAAVKRPQTYEYDNFPNVVGFQSGWLCKVTETGLGVKDISDSIVTKEYYQAFNQALQLLLQRGLNLLLHPDFVYRLTPMYRQMMKNVAVIHNVSDVVISKRCKEREEMKKIENKDQNLYGKRPKFKSYLDILFDLRDSDSMFTDEQIKADVNTIIVGGQETTGTTLLYTLLMLGCHPDVQEKLYTEMKGIYGDSKRPVETEDLTRMKYCEAVLNETLRLYPPLPSLMRLADRDLKLKSCTIPKGAGCLINAWGVGRSRRVWGPDAKEFRPERWLEPNSTGYSVNFLPFSYGRRACIGKKYSMALLKTFLVHCVRELEFVSDANKMQFKIDLALRPITNYMLQIRLRE